MSVAIGLGTGLTGNEYIDYNGLGECVVDEVFPSRQIYFSRPIAYVNEVIQTASNINGAVISTVPLYQSTAGGIGDSFVGVWSEPIAWTAAAGSANHDFEHHFTGVSSLNQNVQQAAINDTNLVMSGIAADPMWSGHSSGTTAIKTIAGGIFTPQVRCNTTACTVTNAIGMMTGGEADTSIFPTARYSISGNNSGTITNYTGVHVGDPDKDTTGPGITTQTGVNVEPLTLGSTIYGIRSQVAAASNRYNIYADGTAENTVNGPMNIGNGAGGASAAGDILRIDKGTTGDDPHERWQFGRAATTDATQTDIWTMGTSAGYVYMVEAKVVFRCTGGAGCTAGQGGQWMSSSVWKNVSGTLTSIGSTALIAIQDDVTGSQSCLFVTSSPTAKVACIGVANANITWHAAVKIQQVGS